ncbi:histidine phosphatase family protein [Microbacterium esteraromaticum]|uniref:histidine phosphatase family protein n=1 Tax=Microbacterium esteraromaticum TaxID=57043 RepID=UPI001CD3E85F|nr:histidine phosphatase family protein [Microbacterium esteraromaticum]MCA1306927.1 histidine phosphatase family protein [Microbacterium esteraromaticum]
MTVALVRHGRTAWNLARRMQGRTEVPLDDHGQAQADAAGALLARAEWMHLIASPLGRAVDTADRIGEHVTGVAREIDDRLIERDYGAAEGLAVSEVHERWPDGGYPDAEPLDAVASRAGSALTEIAARRGNSIVVAHGTLLRVGVETLTGSPCPRILNGQIVMLEVEEAGRFTARFLTE